jgi:hypothetical protein
MNSQRRLNRTASIDLGLQNYSTYPPLIAVPPQHFRKMRAGDLLQVLGEDVVYILSCSDQADLTVASGCTASPRFLAHIYRTCKIITISETNSDDLKLCFSSDLFINSGSFLPVFLPPFCHHHDFPSQTLASINLNLSSIFTSPFSEPRSPKTHRRRIFRSA